MRLQPDLSLYRRVWVNILIAAVVNLEEHPDADKFPREALNLISIIRRDYPGNAGDAQLAYLEKMAIKNLDSITAKQVARRAAGQPFASEVVPEDFSEVNLQPGQKNLLDGLAGLRQRNRARRRQSTRGRSKACTMMPAMALAKPSVCLGTKVGKVGKRKARRQGRWRLGDCGRHHERL